MTSVTYEIMSGKRRNSKLLYSKEEKQFYLKKSEARGRMYYTCYEENCKSRVVLENGQCRKATDFIEHKHGEQQKLYDELKALNEIKQQCLDVTSTFGSVNAVSGIRENYRNVCVRNQESTKNIDFNKVKRGLQYLTAKVFAASPKTPTEVANIFKKENIFKNVGLTLHDDPDKTAFFKVCHDSKNFAYCIFGSGKIVELINESIPSNNNKRILIDGTFSVVPLGCFFGSY